MKKWILPIVALLAGVFVGICIPERNTEYDKLVKIAELQAVKIALIEQASKLDNYTAQLVAAKRKAEQNVQISDPTGIE